MEDNQVRVKVVSSGLTFDGLLTVVFIVLKLTNVIDWSWWWIFSPLWLPPLIIFGGYFLVLGTLILVNRIREWWQWEYQGKWFK